jgi:hypothetical protein
MWIGPRQHVDTHLTIHKLALVTLRLPAGHLQIGYGSSVALKRRIRVRMPVEETRRASDYSHRWTSLFESGLQGLNTKRIGPRLGLA